MLGDSVIIRNMNMLVFLMNKTKSQKHADTVSVSEEVAFS